MDALTALAILATTIALSLPALSVARRAAEASAEARAAKTALTAILNQTPRAPGSYTGVLAHFDWSLLVNQETGTSLPVRLCRQEASLRSRTSGRRYVFESRSTCPQAQQAS